jgi:hypothetical protein
MASKTPDTIVKNYDLMDLNLEVKMPRAEEARVDLEFAKARLALAKCEIKLRKRIYKKAKAKNR